MLLLFAFAAALGAQAQANSAATVPVGDQAIVVTGQKDTHTAVEEFVRSLTTTTSGGQLSRFEHEVCPAVFGIAKPQADAVAARIRLVAKSVGIVVGSQNCAPNVLLLVTSDKKAFLEELRRHRGDDFGITGRQFRALEDAPGPAAAWQVQGPAMTADGVDLTEDTTQGVVVNRTVAPPSRITVPVHPQFDASILVVERKALVGVTTTQLADYTAIRGADGGGPRAAGQFGCADDPPRARSADRRRGAGHHDPVGLRLPGELLRCEARPSHRRAALRDRPRHGRAARLQAAAPAVGRQSFVSRSCRSRSCRPHSRRSRSGR